MFGNESANGVEHSRRVREMFGAIAGRYDLLNHLLSGNIDKRWRRLVARSVHESLSSRRSGETKVLDVACGTGDLSLTLFDSGEAQIIGLDFCRPMLEIARSKATNERAALPFIEGDALQLPFSNETFDAVTIAFGLRNLANVEAGVKELIRVLKPNGRLFVLEFSKPQTPILRSLFQFYFTRVLPLFGGLISGSRGAYEYLPDSVSHFPNQEELASIMAGAGLEEVDFQNLTGGIAALHIGKRPVN
ncbi:MAG TPA: bifunctional demethylmenaquinone methyltransferase/2-methoxy-6-polyprenyl-1,4-benzoquinol methylase UbiE [Pyrinomonadaceae bacterium]|nr:bifunctional demethylmenaquinone methyltransferase/2-methoxy-6-polyprenyl-1,4-benzoquinol methylase UbiE [Pyrinomonadaceae bacterium]